MNCRELISHPGVVMLQTLVASVALFHGSWSFAFGDEAKDPPTGRVARKFAEIKKSFEAEEKDLKKKLADSQDPDDRKQLTFSLKELSAITANDAIELATENPKDEVALDVSIFALKLLGSSRVTGPDFDKATAFLLDNHINSPKIQPVLEFMSEAGSSGRHFLKTAAEKTTNKEVQGTALFYCALSMNEQIADQEGQMNDAGAKQLRTEAIEMIEKAVKLSPDAKVGDQTLAKAAMSEIISLKIGVGNLIPDIEGVELDGKKVKLSSLRGKVVLLDFWATWCGPCVAMIPHERDLIKKLPEKHFTLLSVNGDEQKSALTEFLEKEKMPWLHWWEGQKGPVAKLFKVQAYPTLYLIDSKGVLRKKWIGSPSSEALDKAVEELVAEAKKG